MPIPLNPAPTDLRVLVKGLPTIKQSGKPFHFLLARVRPNLIMTAWRWLWKRSAASFRCGCTTGVISFESFAHGKSLRD
jgi:chromosome partitioning protein